MRNSKEADCDFTNLDYREGQKRAPKGKSNGGQFVKENNGTDTVKKKSAGKKPKRFKFASYSYVKARISDSVVNLIQELVSDMPDDSVKSAVVRALNNSRVAEEDSPPKDGDYYDPNYNVVRLLRGTKEGIPDGVSLPGEVVVHECLHYLDRYLSKKNTYYSEEYHNGEFRKTIKEEASELLKRAGYKSSMKSAEREVIMKKIADQLNEEGFPPECIGTLSDVICGSYNGRVALTNGHSIRYYTDEDGDENKSTEAFAGFGATYAVNPKGRELLQKYLPRSCKVFEKMCAERFEF